jgi:Kef-type K+ transport system membrane component KefB
VTLLDLHPPHGTAWELVLAVLVIIVAPPLFERFRIPGMIGLLAGGCILGPNVLGVVSDSTGIVKYLGTVGLLYLMFMAGLELDLGVFARFRKQAITFALLTFALPVVFGMAAGFMVDYSFAAALLLGSLFASYTLVVYPILRTMGLAANKAVALSVGATVITDTLALIVLAAVAGYTRGSASGFELFVQIALGFALLCLYCFVVLERVARWFFAGIGRSKSMRYLFVLVAMLSSGVLAEVLGIESIVGAFFAGLALNRLVPNEGEFMERIEFFGSALLIPLFLVSVGAIIDPAVMIDPGTLALGGLFTAACVLGKLLAAVACKPLFKFSWDEIGVMFGLSVVQAAATLAATFVGLEIGLFSMATVNAVMIVIVVTMVVASTSAQFFGRRLPKPPIDTSRLGRSVVLQVDEAAELPALLGLARRLADRDGGVVRPILVVPDGTPEPTEEAVAALHHAIESTGADAELSVVHDASITDGVLHTAAAARASLMIVPAATQSWLPTLFEASQHQLVASSATPTALVRLGRSETQRVVLALNAAQAARPSSAAMQAAQVAARLAKGGALTVVSAADPAASLVEIWKQADVVRVDSTHDWFAAEGRASDLLVAPGGRNGALATARLSKVATGVGATMVVVADRESVSSPSGRAEGLGIMATRSGNRV